MNRIQFIGWVAAMQMTALAAETPGGAAMPDPSALGLIELSVPQWPANGSLEIPWDGRPLAAASLNTTTRQFVYSWELVQNGQRLHLNLRSATSKTVPSVLTLEVETPLGQLADGRIHFPLNTGKPENLQGTSQSWSWEYTPTRPGAYTVEVTAACSKYTGEVVEFGTQKDLAMGMVNGTGNKSRFIQSSIGRFVVTDTQPQRLFLRHGEGERVKSVILGVSMRPTSETGRIISQDSLGNIALPAADVTLNGTHSFVDPTTKSFVRWVNESDALAWEFNVRQPGGYSAELNFQKGTLPDGSEIEVTVGGRTTHVRSNGSNTLQCEVAFNAPGEQRLGIRFHHKVGSQPVELRDIRLTQKVGDFAVKTDL